MNFVDEDELWAIGGIGCDDDEGISAVAPAANCDEGPPKTFEFRFFIASSTDQQLTCSKILESDGEIWNKNNFN